MSNPDKVDDGDALNMREAVQEALLGGADLDKLHETYAWLRELYGDMYTEAQVNGTVSYKLTPEGDLVLEKDHEAVSRYQNWLRSGVGEVVTDDGTDVVEVSVLEKAASGEHTEYDNRTKNAWRRRWGEYLSSRMPRDERATANVLCFPGKRGLEADLYLEMGFQPENIFCIEGGDAQAREEFEVEMRKRGIEPRTGRLKKMITAEDGPFDVVSLDLLGSHSQETINSVINLRIRRNAYALVNWMAGREGKFNQTTMRLLHSRLNLKGDSETLSDPFEADTEAGVTLDQSRELVGYNIMRKIGEGRRENWMYPEKLERMEVPDLLREIAGEKTSLSAQERRFTEIYTAFSLGLKMLVRSAFGVFEQYDPKYAIPYAGTIMNVGSQAVFGAPLVTDIERVKYVSEAAGRKTYLSDFGTLHQPAHRYQGLKHTARFIVDCVLDLHKMEERAGHLHIRDKHGRSVNVHSGIARSSSLHYEGSASGFATSIKMARLHNDGELVERIGEEGLDPRIGEISKEQRQIITP